MRGCLPLIVPVVGINLMSLLDAVSTGLLVDNESFIELNPLMDSLMRWGYLEFLVIKLAITLVGTLACWHCFERKGYARTLLTLVSRLYCALLIWQALLLSQVID